MFSGYVKKDGSNGAVPLGKLQETLPSVKAPKVNMSHNK